MGIIKQISVYDGNSWVTDDIGVNAFNVELSSQVIGQTNVQSVLKNLLPSTKKLNGNSIIATDNNNRLTTVDNVSPSNLSYLSGTTGNIQNQINSLSNTISTKANKLDETLKWGIASNTNGSEYPHVQLRRSGNPNNGESGLSLVYYKSASTATTPATFYNLINHKGQFKILEEGNILTQTVSVKKTLKKGNPLVLYDFTIPNVVDYQFVNMMKYAFTGNSQIFPGVDSSLIRPWDIMYFNSWISNNIFKLQVRNLDTSKDNNFRIDLIFLYRRKYS